MMFGTTESYKDSYKVMFADTLTDIDYTDSRYGDCIVDAFIEALQEWKDYHAKQVVECERVEQRIRSALTM